MVIIFLKTLEKKKGVNDVRPKTIERRLRDLHTMSRGTTLFSCGTVEADRWLDMGQIQQAGAGGLESLWDDVMPEPGSWQWAKEPGSATAITSLIRDLSLSHEACCVTGPPPFSSSHTSSTAALHNTPTTATATTTTTTPPSATATSQAPTTAPPNKRQCRSLSFSDEYGGFRSSWRPQGSRLWTTVEKRRCHSGGSVQRGVVGGGGGGGYTHHSTMQRSSSFSLPSRSTSAPSSDGALDLPFFNQRLPLHPQFTASPVSPTSPLSSHHHHHHHPHHPHHPQHHHHSSHHPHHHHFLRPLSLSHEQISLEEAGSSSPDSTPELGRRARQRDVGGGGAGGVAGITAMMGSGLSRSRSQPCVLNDNKKIGMKRRRPEDAQEQRPSLDLAKMTQKLQTFQSLSCPGFSATDCCQSSLAPPTSQTFSQLDSDFAAVSELGLESRQEVAHCDDREEEEEEEEDEEVVDSSYEELDSDSAYSVDSMPASPADTAGPERTLWKGERGTQRDIFQLGGELDLDQIERN